MPELEADQMRFTDVKELGVRARAYEDTDRYYCRLPARAKGRVPEVVWHLAQASAGMYVDFYSDTGAFAAELTLDEDPERPQPGRDCSIDVYAHDGNRWGWVGFLRNLERPTTRDIVVRGLPRERRLYRICLPHGGRVAELKLGVEPDAVLEAAPAPSLRPVCCYGTSIIHGFSASRCGMTMPAQLSRRLGRPVMNFGFSGNGRMEVELAELLGEVDAGAYAIDCLPNMGPELVTERTVPFIHHLREARPDTPILLVENIVYQATYMLEDRRGGWGPKNDALKRQFARLQDEGVEGLHYLSGQTLLGADGEATADGTHPNDLGMTRLTDAYEAALRPML
jgi:GDSL-like Lipase/Acylhydrolase family/N-terminus of Esterase_SGNH_hydro-type